MKIEILLPTEYIGRNNNLVKLDSSLLKSTEKDLVSVILKYEGGVTKTKVEGYYKSNKGVLTLSKYISLVVYTENMKLFNVLMCSDVLRKVCVLLKQESIGVVVDNKFYCVS